MNWMDSYINRVTTGSFNLEIVKNLCNNLIKKLNDKGQGKLSKKIEFDDNYTIIFPDCKFNFIIDDNNLVFNKLARQSEELLDTLKLADTGENIYIFRQGNKISETQDVESAVEFVFNFFLTKSVNLQL